MACPDCFKGTIHEGEPSGIEETIHGVRTYVTAPASNSTSKSTIIFITDAFGFNLVNSKLLADYYASQTGIRVLIPDIIPGGGVPLTTLSLTESVSAPIRWFDIPGRVWWAFSLGRLLSIVIPFAIRSRGVFPSILAYARAVKAELPEGGTLGVAGFCWGGMQSTKLAAESTTEGGTVGLVDAHFTAHPVGLKSEDFVEGVRKFKVPFSMAVGEKDAYLKPDVVAGIEAALRTGLGEGETNGYEVKVYPECGHGFAVRAEEKRTVENEAAGKAAEQAILLFKKHLA
jgi:dienelactone hydrolase